MILDASGIAAAVRALEEGRVVAAATESSFGLLADANNPVAVERVFAIKGRDEGKGVALVTPSFEAWNEVVHSVPRLALDLARAFWPGGLTLALPARVGLDSRLLVQGTVGVRMPGPCQAAVVARAFGRVLTATSANLAGEPPLCHDADVRERLSPRDASLLVLPGIAPGGPPSTVVKVAGGAWNVVRTGTISRDAIERALARPTPGLDR
jgi:L-threonylcarbamoyladenylate synthase